MLDGIKINANEVSSYLWVAVIAAVFSMCSLRYDPRFINYGFITFVYGITGHNLFKAFDAFEIEGKKEVWTRILLKLASIGIWLYFLVNFA